MKRLLFCLAIIALLTTAAGCSNAADNDIDEVGETTSNFTGTIKEINGHNALVQTNSKIFKASDSSQDKVIVDLSVNSEQKFEVENEIKVKFDGPILDSDPPQINTLSVELVKSN